MQAAGNYLFPTAFVSRHRCLRFTEIARKAQEL
jgi:hypothetical protein